MRGFPRGARARLRDDVDLAPCSRQDRRVVRRAPRDFVRRAIRARINVAADFYLKERVRAARKGLDAPFLAHPVVRSAALGAQVQL